MCDARHRRMAKGAFCRQAGKVLSSSPVKSQTTFTVSCQHAHVILPKWIKTDLIFSLPDSDISAGGCGVGGWAVADRFRT